MILTRRQTLLTGAAAFAAATLPARAARPEYRLHPQEIASGVWMFEGATESFDPKNGGAICNIVMLASHEGAIVIDTGGTARQGAALRAFADQRLGGVAASLNTHHHPDHWFGNQAFADRPIHALPRTRRVQSEDAQVLADGLYRILGSWMNGTTPRPASQDAVAGGMTIGGRELEILALSGHSQADLVVQDRQTGTLITGDLLFLNRAPSFPDADIPTWASAITTIAQIPASGYVPGHGPYHRDSRAMGQTQHYLSAMDARLRGAANNGLTRIEAMAAGPMPDYAHLGANPQEYQRSVIQRWREYELRALPILGQAG
ncbi:quinoprotein relay system zinc metallohydrolase 1 [Paracoccus seriniphilus]|uniref:quinoprotein relay system zinc metallohydrolase 1 n=1 Tax=Paracoccus seriniphilus TaxID=184748 RepID=UPI003566532A